MGWRALHTVANGKKNKKKGGPQTRHIGARREGLFENVVFFNVLVRHDAGALCALDSFVWRLLC